MILKDFKKYSTLIYIGITVIFFVTRIIFFTASFGGVEHDSGWYLGVAKNLAVRGIYASYTNTIREERVGAHPSIHGRFSVQDAEGYTYFPAGVSVGPGYIFPEALIIKVFGDGFWQYRLWPLITFSALLVVLFLIIYFIGGMIPLLIFQLWLWAVPQLTTMFAYESFSEHIALLYLLLSFLFLYMGFKKRKSLLYLLSGVFFSFSILTKIIFSIGIIAFGPIIIWDLILNRNTFKKIAFRWMLFIVGIIGPLVFFELYRFIELVSRFGLEGWHAVNKDVKIHFQSNGSGSINFNVQTYDWQFINKKISIWKDAAVKLPILAWIVYLSSIYLVFRGIRQQYRVLVILMYFTSLATFVYFIFISPTGWARYAWNSLILGMVLISLCLGVFLKNSAKNLNYILLLGVILFLIALVAVRYESTWVKPKLDEETVTYWQKNRYIRGIAGFPTHNILSLSDQKELIGYFRKNIHVTDRIYYIGWFLNAEISPLVDKVFYTLDRYFVNQQNSSGGKSYAIFGPYQQGIWSIVPRSYLPEKAYQLCETIVFRNSSYLLCILKKGISYKNEAYN